MEHPELRFGMLGGHTEIVYDGVRVGRDALLGEEGEGFVIAQHRLVPGRIHHCMRWLGIAQRAFDMMCERSLYRPVRGGLLRDKQTAQNWIADSSIQIQAARLMTLHAAWKIDTQGSSAARVDVSRIKVFGAQMLYDVVDRALQLHGGLGFSTDMPLEAMYRFARHARFVDGADEVHRESIARQILKSYQAPEDGVPTEYVPVRREQARLKFAGLLDALALDEPGVVAS
jgi:acyl-CoA dehydrogenase